MFIQDFTKYPWHVRSFDAAKPFALCHRVYGTREYAVIAWFATKAEAVAARATYK